MTGSPAGAGSHGVPGADLHAHSDVSDGTVSPVELVRMAAQAGLAAVALTDHDTVEGVPEAVEEARRAGVELVAGVELSIDWQPGTMHLLGLFVDIENSELGERLGELQQVRAERTPLMVERLRAAGCAITLEAVLAKAGRGVSGRPHVAAVLVDEGYAADISDAFRRWLRRGAAGYVHAARLAPAEGIDMVRAAGGVSVLCHPLQIGLAGAELRSLCARLRDRGLDAVEVFHSDHNGAAVLDLGDMAAELGMLASGGSDFHGDHKPGVRLGAVDRGRPLPLPLVERLRERAFSRRLLV